MALLQLANITKSFGAVRALKGVSFELQAGEIHALLGENGAGKSTLIKIITGAHRPDSGTISLDGHEVQNLTPAIAHKSGIACIYQQPALFPDLTVAENIGMRLEAVAPFRRIAWKARRTKSGELLRRIGADISPDREIRELSMPEQQLVEIACAIGAGARIVIMDEPTASLTQKEQHLLFAVARELRSSGVGVIYISHRLEEIFSLADRVTVLRDGESISSNRIDELNETVLIRLMVGREISQIFPESERQLGEVVLSLRNVSCIAGGISDVSFDVREGEVLGLAGLVGAGRTELARILFGVTPLDSGEIRIRGQTVSIRSPNDAIENGIAYVPEDRRRHGVILEMPIVANITMASHRELFPSGWMHFDRELHIASEYIRDLSIKASSPEAPVKSLSGGNEQKVAVARWLTTKPTILILDEPTQGVDIGAKSEIYRIIRSFTARGMAVLMISSDLPEILGMSDRIAVMRNGRIATIQPGKTAAHDVMAAAVGAKG